jgi:hypothetical protein
MAKATFFKKVRGAYKHFRGNPFKKNVVVGHFDKHGKFHKRKRHTTHTRKRKTTRRGKKR